MNGSPPPIQFMTAYEVSALFRIPLSTVYHLVKTGRMRAVRVGKHLRIFQPDVEALYRDLLEEERAV